MKAGLMLAALLLISGSAMGQDPVQSEVAAPDSGTQGTDAQIAINAARIMDLKEAESARSFYLQLFNAFGVLVIGIVTLVTRHNVKTVATAIDGVKDELVATTLAKGRLQGAKTEHKAQAGRDRATARKATKRKPRAAT